VAQWEKLDGTFPTVDNLGRVATTTAVSFEWLATGRGRMVVTAEEIPAVVLEEFAQTDAEARLLRAFRRLPSEASEALLTLARSFGDRKRL
jgi:hypothetical protein